MIRSCRIVQPIRYPRQRPIFQRRYHNLNDERVVVALSGGVDSSVALGLLLAKQRDSISAIYMSNWNLYDDDTVQCTTEVDWKDAQAVARHFQCPIQRVALEAEYWTCVFEPFLDGLSAQQMGNPDIACNTHIKFGALLEIVKKRYGQDTVLATGHYARLWNPSREAAPPFLQSVLDNDSTGLLHWVKESSLESNASILLAAADSSKDQSYFLSGCSGQALRDACFPLGDLYKKSNHSQGAPTVRQLAMEWKVPVANKKDSTGICFVGRRRSFRQFLLQNHYLPRAHAPVDFIDVDTQNVVGTTAPKNAHPVLFTPGQGAKISGRPTKYFVVGILEPTKDFHHNHHHRVGVCAGTHHPALYADTLFLHNVHWITGCPPPRGFNGPSLRLKCRIRHLQPLQDCTLAYDDAGKFKVTFDLPLRGITSGQQAVLYDPSGLVCLGGGAIVTRGPSLFEMGQPMPQKAAAAGHNDRSVLNICS